MNTKTLLAAILTTSVLVAVPAASYAKGNCSGGGNGQQMSEVKADCKGGKGEHRGGHKKGDHKGGKSGMMRMDRMAKKLELTDEQAAEIKQIMESSREAKDSLRERMIESRQALRALDTTAADYDTNVEGIASTIAGLEQEKIVKRADIRKQIESVLTDEQKAKMAQMKDKMGKRNGKQKG